MDLAKESFTGLWDVVRVANTDSPEMSDTERLKLAKRVVRDLVARGWVELYERNADGPFAETQLEPSRVDGALAEDIGWDWRGVREVYVQYLIAITDRGRREFDQLQRQQGELK